MAPNPALVAAIRRQPAHLRIPLLTTALIESGGRLDAVGDNGQSFGPYQEYTGGRGAGVAPRDRMNPVASTARAAREFATFYGRGARGADLAYRAQRPADRGNYLARYAQYAPQAQRILGMPTAPGAARRPGRPAPSGGGGGGQLTPDSSAAVRRYLAESEADVLAGRLPGDVAPVVAGLKRTGAPAAAGRQVALGSLQQTGRAANPSDSQFLRAVGFAKDYAPGGKFDPNPKDNLGVDYSWGGGGMKGPTFGIAQGANIKGIDCSGLTEYAWAKVGVNIGPTTVQQIKTGTAVRSMAQARPGDLLFPSTGHVQLFLGDGKVLEAPRTGGHVQIVPARSSYIAIRRPG